MSRSVALNVEFPSKPIPGGNTVVLHLSAHGIEYPKDDKPLLTCNKTHISTLSFPGYVGTLGIMPVKQSRDTPAFDSASLAVIVNNYRSKGTNPIDHVEIMEENKRDVMSLLESKNYIQGMIALTGSSFNNYNGLPPFQILSHIEYERVYIFEPNPHEDCDNNCEGKWSSVCTERSLLDRKCPFYGLNIIYADKTADDKLNSFAGISSSVLEVDSTTTKPDSEYILEHKLGNLHQNSTLRNYWETRIYNTKANKESKTIVGDIFHKLTRDNEIKLSDLCVLFKFLGYQNIFIYDPTCRSCDITHRLEKDPSRIDTDLAIRGVYGSLLPIYQKELTVKLLRERAVKSSRYSSRVSHKQLLHNNNSAYERNRRFKKALKLRGIAWVNEERPGTRKTTRKRNRKGMGPNSKKTRNKQKGDSQN